MRLISLSALISAFLTLSAHAEPVRYDIDSAHTDIVWKADHLGFSKSVGEFASSSGFIELDRENPSASKVEATIELTSIATGNAKFDEHLKSKDFFSVNEFRRATFKSTGVEITGENTAKITGDLDLHGVIKPVTLDVTLNKTGKNPFTNNETVGFSARTTIYRSQFGITYALPMVGDEVDLVIEAEGTLPTAEPTKKN